MNNIECVYIVNGHMIKSMCDFTWVEEVFIDEKQANAYCEHLKNTNSDKINFHVVEHKICTYDYVNLLKETKEFYRNLMEEQEMRRMGCGA